MTITLPLRGEGLLLGKIALPLVAGYLAELMMFITTKIVVGELGYHELASVGITSSLTFEIIAIMMGLISIVGVLCAQAEGAGQKRMAGAAVRQGFFISLVLGIPATLCVLYLDKVLIWTGQDPLVVEHARPFLNGMAGHVIPVMLFAVLRNYVAALSRATSVMLISAIAVTLNYALTVWFVHGGAGLPAMGLFGAGLAFTVVTWLMLFCMLAYVYLTPALRGYGVFAGRWKIEPALCREILVLGVPVAGIVFLEAGMFAAASILSGVISAETLAAYEIVMSWTGISFVIALGIAEATMVRVGIAAGGGSMQYARGVGFYGMGAGSLVLAVLMLIPLVYPQAIVGLFVDTAGSESGEVAELATQLLFIAAIFGVFDGLQAIASRSLRALKDNIAPLWIAGFGYWVLGIGGGALLAFYFEMNGAGLWWGFALGLMTTSIMLAVRFHLITNRIALETQARRN